MRTDFGNDDFDIAYAAALQPDGKIVAAGTTSFDFGVSQDFALARCNPNGTLDTTFDADGRVLIDFGSYLQHAFSVLIQPDGKIVTVGYPATESDDSDFLLARCNTNGSLDPSLGPECDRENLRRTARFAFRSARTCQSCNRMERGNTSRACAPRGARVLSKRLCCATSTNGRSGNFAIREVAL